MLNKFRNFHVTHYTFTQWNTAMGHIMIYQHGNRTLQMLNTSGYMIYISSRPSTQMLFLHCPWSCWPSITWRCLFVLSKSLHYQGAGKEKLLQLEVEINKNKICFQPAGHKNTKNTKGN